MKLVHVIVLLVGLFAVSCFDDESTVDTRQISVVSIDTTKIQKIFNRDKNEIFNLDISSYISQTNKALPLSYQWDMDYKFYSDSSILSLDCRNLGSFPIRVKVSNDDGSAFYEFTLNVNSPYEEGIAVLSGASDGTPLLSFMREYSEGENVGQTSEFYTNCLQVNNPDVIFPKKPADMAKRLSQLFIAFKDEPSVYIVNAKTFELENVIHASEYAGFAPEKIMMPDNTARTAVIISEDGSAYNLASYEGLILPHTVLKSKYSAIQHVYFKGYNPLYYLWDTQKHSVGYFSGYSIDFFQQFGPVWEGEHEVVAMFEDKDKSTFTTLTRLNGEYWKTTITNNIYILDPDTYQKLGVDLRDKKVITGNPELTASDPTVGSAKFQQLLYAKGNKIYRWFYSNLSFPTDSWISIDDLPGAQISCLGISPDETKIYVGVYKPGESGLNGYVYIYDSSKGTLLDSYKNVAYKPLKIMYKAK